MEVPGAYWKVDLAQLAQGYQAWVFTGAQDVSSTGLWKTEL